MLLASQKDTGFAFDIVYILSQKDIILAFGIDYINSNQPKGHWSCFWHSLHFQSENIILASGIDYILISLKETGLALGIDYILISHIGLAFGIVYILQSEDIIPAFGIDYVAFGMGYILIFRMMMLLFSETTFLSVKTILFLLSAKTTFTS